MVELTPKLFVELTLEMLPKVLSKLVDAVAKNKEKLEKAAGPEELMGILFEIVMELRNEVGGDLLPEGITNEDMEAYKKKHEAEIQEYIESNPEIKEKWDNLQQEFQEKFQEIAS
ncbi:MAG: hypothetical protein HWN66_18690 [Candidatus Helarchaeota archaeon]|nr:hypothetical protein [Candidatus Helarchaeota archaeon]